MIGVEADAVQALILKFGDTVAPAGTVTVAGTLAITGLKVVRLTTASPAGAGALSTTRPVTTPPGATLAELSVTAETVIGTAVRGRIVVDDRPCPVEAVVDVGEHRVALGCFAAR